MVLELLHRHVIHACRPAVGFNFFESLPQVGQGIDLVNQAEPFVSFHPLFEGRQHPFRPNLRFHPGPSGADRPGVRGFSYLRSRFRHCRRWRFLRLVRHVSTFLRSLRSMAVTPLHRYYGRSDSCPPGSSALFGHERRLLHEQVSLIHPPRLRFFK
jgi:hypothetical protein